MVNWRFGPDAFWVPIVAEFVRIGTQKAAARIEAARVKSRAPRERYGRGRCAARGDSNGTDHPPLVDLSALASTRPTSPVVPEGMAGDAALSARLRVAPLRSRHEGIRPIRSGRIRIDCDGPLVKTLNPEEHSVAEARWRSPSSKTLADEVGLRRTGGSPHQLCRRRLAPRQAGSPVGGDWVVVVPCTDSAVASWTGAVLRPMPEGT